MIKELSVRLYGLRVGVLGLAVGWKMLQVLHINMI